MTLTAPWSCPLCARAGRFDERPPAEIAGLVFRSVNCDQPPASLADHPFPLRWLESKVADKDELVAFNERFTYVRGPLPEGSPIALAFGDTDPILAWVEDHATEGGLRLLIRL